MTTALDRIVVKWNTVHSVLMLLVFVVSFYLETFVYAAIAFIISISGLLFLSKIHLARFPGYANALTWIRALIIALITLNPQSDVWLFYIFLALLLSDLLDGYLARKFGEESIVGSYLDMESDAFVVFAMTFLLYFLGKAPFIMLLPAIMRYLYGTIIWVLRINEVAEPKRPEASMMAGIYFGVLVASFILPYDFRILPQLVVLAIIVYSFGRSFVYQWSTHRLKNSR